MWGLMQCRYWTCSAHCELWMATYPGFDIQWVYSTVLPKTFHLKNGSQRIPAVSRLWSGGCDLKPPRFWMPFTPSVWNFPARNADVFLGGFKSQPPDGRRLYSQARKNGKIRKLEKHSCWNGPPESKFVWSVTHSLLTTGAVGSE